MDVSEPMGVLIKQINDALLKSANKILKEDELTLSQVGLLTTLYAADGYDMTLKQLEKVLRVSQPTVHGIVRRLQQKKLVALSEDRENLRIKHVTLTDQGILQCQKGQTHMQEAEEMLSRDLTPDERDELIILLQKVRDSIQ